MRVVPVITTLFAFTIMFSIFEPVTGLLLYRALGGMHGGTFGDVSPSLYISISVVVKYAVSVALAVLLLKLLKMKNRIPNPIGGFYLIWIGGVLMTLPILIRILTSSVEGGGMTFAVFSIIGPFLGIAKLLFFCGLFFFLLSVKPAEKYTHP